MKISIITEEFCCNGQSSERIDAIFFDDNNETAEKKAENYIKSIGEMNQYFHISYTLYDVEPDGTFEILN